MLARLAETIAQLKKHPPPIRDADLTENLAFLGWLADNHFTFLGCRAIFSREGGEAGPESGLGVCRTRNPRHRRRRSFRSRPNCAVSHATGRSSSPNRARAPCPPAVAHGQYRGQEFRREGKLIGERPSWTLHVGRVRTIATEIPLLRRGRASAGDQAAASGHDGKALAHVRNTFPRDELFQISEATAADALSILNLGERPRCSLPSLR
jgi:glutamate dehydrogenase